MSIFERVVRQISHIIDAPITHPYINFVCPIRYLVKNDVSFLFKFGLNHWTMLFFYFLNFLILFLTMCFPFNFSLIFYFIYIAWVVIFRKGVSTKSASFFAFWSVFRFQICLKYSTVFSCINFAIFVVFSVFSNLFSADFIVSIINII